MSSPPPKSLVPAPTVWPPSNPSGTVVPFPLPWGQTGCCPPGGMSALMQCYCDLQQASAFIGQVMLDQINNNPAIIQAIIAGIEASGSSLPTLGVTNGSAAQPGQVGEYQRLIVEGSYPTGTNTQVLNAGVLQPGDWLLMPWCEPAQAVDGMGWVVSPVPAGLSNGLVGYTAETGSIATQQMVVGQSGQLLSSVPTLLTFNFTTVATGGSTFQFAVECWRMR